MISPRYTAVSEGSFFRNAPPRRTTRPDPDPVARPPRDHWKSDCSITARIPARRATTHPHIRKSSPVWLRCSINYPKRPGNSPHRHQSCQRTLISRDGQIIDRFLGITVRSGGRRPAQGWSADDERQRKRRERTAAERAGSAGRNLDRGDFSCVHHLGPYGNSIVSRDRDRIVSCG